MGVRVWIFAGLLVIILFAGLACVAFCGAEPRKLVPRKAPRNDPNRQRFFLPVDAQYTVDMSKASHVESKSQNLIALHQIFLFLLQLTHNTQAISKSSTKSDKFALDYCSLLELAHIATLSQKQKRKKSGGNQGARAH